MKPTPTLKGHPMFRWIALALLLPILAGCSPPAANDVAPPERLGLDLWMWTVERDGQTYHVFKDSHGISVVQVWEEYPEAPQPDDAPAILPPTCEHDPEPEAEPEKERWPADAVRVWDTDNSFANWAEAQLVSGAHPLPSYAEVRDGKIFHKESGERLRFFWCSNQLGAVARSGGAQDGFRSSLMVPRDIHDKWLPVRDQFTIQAVLSKQ